ncbi:hypothetical protein BT93_F1572 [Corymbia citriodora subsp. variegata]|nr:hypothetical protein BT93_F1572 [Corymbia citriodora subsp. variegata]KAF8024433.1 hypothetical protein BT93_F1572 [Corymbia citriodora subsp. variegata]KAF8024434.1 hypothetical protein BT93_F1572 [Corymbia citriodora subsp. variegata]
MMVLLKVTLLDGNLEWEAWRNCWRSSVDSRITSLDDGYSNYLLTGGLLSFDSVRIFLILICMYMEMIEPKQQYCL